MGGLNLKNCQNVRKVLYKIVKMLEKFFTKTSLMLTKTTVMEKVFY